MSSQIGNGPLVDIQPTYGAVLIGILVSTCLLGVTFSQGWRYFQNFPKDPIHLKIVVSYVLVIESIRLAFSIHGVYYYLVLKWGNPLALSDLIWTSQVTLLMTTLAVVAVRLYFSYRVWIRKSSYRPFVASSYNAKVSQRNLLITGWIVLCSLAHLAVGIVTWVLSIEHDALSAHTTELHSFGTAGLSLEIMADWSISLSLIYFLNRGRSALPQTNAIINRIMFYTVNMGLLTSSTDIVILVLSLWSTPQPQLYYLAIYHIIGNLYANSLLARTAMRAMTNNMPLSDFAVFSAASGPENASLTLDGFRRSHPNEGPISMSKETLKPFEQGYVHATPGTEA
ncbi:hypothetical protein CVT26_010289 [Gymnopilus dilepis]|uniref:DUF6534 domain-containing protein n=1 Tax=Gymnopilus dilepis TaxID=231916 RepID=A0A409Y0V9_9AGAR|nr:hypothetical protein CVT26_010289 [Gymnopilus dilepis]